MSENSTPLVNSMTGYASQSGQNADLGYNWTWELRSVNGRGLDLRLRIPDWLEGVEAKARAALQARLKRGSVTLNLRVQRVSADSDGETLPDSNALDQALDAVALVEDRALAAGMTLVPVSAADLLSIVSRQDSGLSSDGSKALSGAVLSDLPALLDAMAEARAGEGRAMAEILSGHIDAVEALVSDAEAVLPERSAAMEAAFAAALARIRAGTDGVDPDRVAQEMALLAVKADVREELDRLTAHVSAARALLREGGPIGRKLDFLSQEFNREANTLCSKAQNASLTAIGLELKARIDQMREQIQNVE